ncbi:phage late control D family protein [Paenibacillus sp. A3M_27_13]|uniref:phage late control D family protein n=1 Tax=Paenibacillus sp. A3M_27_13 TaxID=2962029 RepID=UPI0020B66925|nr:phage late control D family protein [Paenibacillus sp. A3M_27_13]MCP3746763.1 phage late control D family protein [Paenibacillus sp. A3M_27_13]
MGYPIIKYNGTVLSLKNTKVKVVQKMNEHVKVFLTGVLTGTQMEEYTDHMEVGTKLVVSYLNDDQKQIVLFRGLVTQLRIKLVSNVAHLVAEATSYTSQLDEALHRQSFQNVKMKVQALLDHVLKSYPKANCTSRLKDQLLQEFTMQFDETDWSFLKRIASRFGWGLIPDPVGEKPQFYFGLPDATSKDELKQYNYSMTRKTKPGASKDDNLLYYKVQTTGAKDILLNIGDEIKFKGEVLHVLQSVAFIRHSALWHEYVLTTSDGMKQELILNEKICGMSLKSKVIGIEEDHVKVFFYEMDKVKPNVKETCSFPHATFYTSEGNTGWYCMPELFDFVDIYFPTKKEKDAIVTHSIRKRSKGGDFISDPSTKIFMTKYRKAIIFEKNEILITGNDDEVVIRLLDDHGIELRSKKDIRVKADGNLMLNAGKTVQITAKDAIGLKCKTSMLEMDGNLKIRGAKVNMQ